MLLICGDILWNCLSGFSAQGLVDTSLMMCSVLHERQGCVYFGNMNIIASIE